MHRYYILILVLINSCYCLGQILIAPSFSDQIYFTSPAAVGVLKQAQIKFSAYSNYSKDFFSPTSPFGAPPVTLNSAIPRVNDEINLLSLDQYRFFGYHNTQSISEKIRITYGLQLQNIKSKTNKIQSPQTFGVTVNAHRRINKKQGVQSFFSGGFQMNLILQKASKTITSHLYRTNLNSISTSYDTFHKQFAKSGSQYRFSMNYLRHKNFKSLLSFGLSFGGAETKVVGSSGLQNSGVFTFNSDSNFDASIFLNWQRNINPKLIFDLTFLGRIDQNGLSLGLGFQLKNNQILRLNLNSLRDQNSNEYSGGSIALDKKRFSYKLAYSIYIGPAITFGPTTLISMQRSHFVQFGGSYDLSDRGKPSLLRLNY